MTSIFGGVSGLFSFIYVFFKIYIFPSSFSKIKKIFFLYFELIAVVLFMHPFLIYTYYMHNVIGELYKDGMIFEKYTIFSFDLIFYLLNFALLCLIEKK